MISRLHGNLILRWGEARDASIQLEREGYAHIPGVLDAAATAALKAEIAEVYETSGPDRDPANSARPSS